VADALSIRNFVPSDKAAWMVLWQEYLEYYRSSVADDITEHLWSQISDQTEPQTAAMQGFGAFRGDELIAITHFTFHASSWSISGYCYLEDLFTAPTGRGQGVGGALIEAVRAEAKARGADRLYWHTQRDNETARRLYDRYNDESGFVQYRIPLV
jgi:GNAT superfamily N-acetyltransferase